MATRKFRLSPDTSTSLQMTTHEINRLYLLRTFALSITSIRPGEAISRDTALIAASTHLMGGSMFSGIRNFTPRAALALSISVLIHLVLVRAAPQSLLCWLDEQCGSGQSPTLKTPFNIAADKGGTEEMLRILREDPLRLRQIFHGGTFAHYLVYYGNEKVLKAVVDFNPDIVHWLNSVGHTPLHRAIANIDASPSLVKMLLAAGPDPNSKDKHHATPLLNAYLRRVLFYKSFGPVSDISVEHPCPTRIAENL